jgi:hypothetical protein
MSSFWGTDPWGTAPWGGGAGAVVTDPLYPNASLVVNGVDLSDHTSTVGTIATRNLVDTTLVGDRFRRREVGRHADQFQVTFLQDYAAGKVHATHRRSQAVRGRGVRHQPVVHRPLRAERLHGA